MICARSLGLVFAMAGCANVVDFHGPCDDDSDCGILPELCCGRGGTVDAYWDNVTAIRGEAYWDYRAWACGGTIAPCTEFSWGDPLGLAAGCEAGRCVVRNLATDPASACEDASDCILVSSSCDGTYGVPLRLAACALDGPPFGWLTCSPECAIALGVEPEIFHVGCGAGRCYWWSETELIGP